MKKLLLVVGALLVTAAAPAKADTISFIDASINGAESVGLSVLGTRASSNCTLSPEVCTVTITLPATTTDVSIISFFSDLAEPPAVGPLEQISDSISLFENFAGPNIVVTFTSDSDAGGLGACNACTVETGQVQLAATITYSHESTPLATDTIQICSDVEGVTSSCNLTTTVPEPASLVLLGTGLLATVSRFRRRRSKPHASQ